MAIKVVDVVISEILTLLQMKKILKYILLLSLFSCQDFLEEQPKNQVSTDQYYKSIGEAEGALIGAYSYLTDMYHGTGINNISDATADVLTLGAGGGGGSSAVVFDNFSFNASSGDLLNAYDNNYNIINAVNTLLGAIEGKNLDTEKQPVIEGEAKFLRAFAYFNLVRLFGDVVLVTQPATSVTGLKKTRDAEDLVYEQIVSDLKDAVASLNDDSPSKGRVNRLSVLALLGKVYLSMGNANDAVDALSQVIGKRSLYPNYADVFKVANENNAIESLFEVQFGLRPNSSDLIQFLTPTQVTGFGQVYSVFAAESSLVDAFEEGDLRKDVTLWNSFNDKSFNGSYIRKFNDGLLPGTDASDAGQINFPLLRYADVLLLYAEALNEVNEGPTEAAYQAVNDVRDRADLDPLPEGLNQEEFLQAILQERLVEFAAEGHRWFDLKRTAKLQEKLSDKGFVEGKHEVFPIPQAARDANDLLTQNNY